MTIPFLARAFMTKNLYSSSSRRPEVNQQLPASCLVRCSYFTTCVSGWLALDQGEQTCFRSPLAIPPISHKGKGALGRVGIAEALPGSHLQWWLEESTRPLLILALPGLGSLDLSLGR